MSSKPLREFSYGGVVVRGDEVVTIRPRGRRTLALPKGGANPDESGEQTALREVREEAGVVATVRGELGDVNYWYQRQGRKIYKTVRFYLCDYVSGDTADHDHEVDEASWVPLDEALQRLSFRGEREMVRRAARRLARERADR
jgi:8-oxo-dGTP pyrophosphatase MutT (NUDIX family)